MLQKNIRKGKEHFRKQGKQRTNLFGLCYCEKMTNFCEHFRKQGKQRTNLFGYPLSIKIYYLYLPEVLKIFKL